MGRIYTYFIYVVVNSRKVQIIFNSTFRFGMVMILSSLATLSFMPIVENIPLNAKIKPYRSNQNAIYCFRGELFAMMGKSSVSILVSLPKG